MMVRADNTSGNSGRRAAGASARSARRDTQASARSGQRLASASGDTAELARVSALQDASPTAVLPVALDSERRRSSVGAHAVASGAKRLLATEVDTRKQGKTKKALKLLLAFLLLMLLLTVLSRTFYNLSLPVVDAGKTRDMAISHMVSLQGALEAKDEVAVTMEPGIVISSVKVRQGDVVAKGQELFRCDMDELGAKIEVAENEVAKLQASLDDALVNEGLTDRQQGLAQSRAQEDVGSAQSSGSAAVQRAEDAMKAAETAYHQAEDDYNAGGPTTLEEVEMLKAAFQSSQDQYYQALDAAQKELTAAQRNLEDSMLGAPADGALAEGLRLDIETQQMTLKKLYALRDAEGKVYAPSDGIVSRVNVQTGEMLAGTAAVVIQDASQGYRFTCIATEDEAKYLDVGMDASLDFASGSTPYRGSISGKAEDPQGGGFVISMDVPKDAAGTASTAVMQSGQKGKSYPTCVPASAVFTSMMNGSTVKYVYVINQKTTVLGQQLVVEQVMVEVLDQNEQYAAIELSLADGQELVYSSSKELKDGDRVRKAD